MEKVFIVFEKDHSNGDVQGVFSTWMDAKEFLVKMWCNSKIDINEFFIGSYTINKPNEGREVSYVK